MIIGTSLVELIPVTKGLIITLSPTCTGDISHTLVIYGLLMLINYQHAFWAACILVVIPNGFIPCIGLSWSMAISTMLPCSSPKFQGDWFFSSIPQRELQIDICTLMIYIYTLAISIDIYILYVHYRYMRSYVHISWIFPVAKSSDFPIAVPSEAQKTGEKSRAGTRVSYPIMSFW